MRIAILGGGISGLTAAFYLHRAGLDFDLFEAADEPGGNMRSRREGDYLMELGPNSLLLSVELQELLQELNLLDQIVEAPARAAANRYILRDGRYRRLPSSPPGLLTSGFFSWGTKLDLLRELRRPAATGSASETVAEFFRRRFNQEIVDYAVNPFVAGIYAGDPNQLLVQQAFPQLVALEQAHGSVLRGLAKAGVGKRRRTISLRNGLQTLPDALAARLAEHVYFHQPVERLDRTPSGQFVVHTPSGAFADRLYDQVLLALPAPTAANLLEPLVPAAAAAIRQVYYPPVAVVHTAYRRQQVPQELEGFGALNPRVEGTYTSGSIWSSSLYPGRCPAKQVLFTSFVGGAQAPGRALEPETDMLAQVHAELCRLYQIEAEAPEWQRRYVWEQAIPQADAQLAPARAAAAELATMGLQVVSNWQAGISVPDCVRYARELAAKISAASNA